MDPEKEGYTFNGWFTQANYASGSAYDFNAEVTGNLTLYGKFEANQYTITYDANGGIATLTAETSAYSAAQGASNEDSYLAVFIPDGSYAGSNSATAAVTIRSTAITWANGSALLVYRGDSTGNDDRLDNLTNFQMLAGSTYTLQIPAVQELGKDGATLTDGTDYAITWYQVDQSGKATVIDHATGNAVVVTPAVSGTVTTEGAFTMGNNTRTEAGSQVVTAVVSDTNYQSETPGGLFKPNGDVTWGEALKLILLAVGYEEQEPTGAHWASGYLTAAQEDDLLGGAVVTDLNEPITRLEYGRVAALAMGFAASDTQSPFADTEDGLILALYDAGIIEGSEGDDGAYYYDPDDNIRRSELATVIWRINNYLAE